MKRETLEKLSKELSKCTTSPHSSFDTVYGVTQKFMTDAMTKAVNAEQERILSIIKGMAEYPVQYDISHFATEVCERISQ